MAKINSRQKGARGEREFAQYLTKYGFDAIRGRQFAGSVNSPDVQCDELADFNFEVKRVEKNLDIEKALQQSERDSALEKCALVAHRRNGELWKITIRAADFIELLKRLRDAQEEIDKIIFAKKICLEKQG